MKKYMLLYILVVTLSGNLLCTDEKSQEANKSGTEYHIKFRKEAHELLIKDMRYYFEGCEKLKEFAEKGSEEDCRIYEKQLKKMMAIDVEKICISPDMAMDSPEYAITRANQLEENSKTTPEKDSFLAYPGNNIA